MKTIVNLLQEISMLARTPRSGYPFLGNVSQSVAEHSHLMTLVALMLAKLAEEPVDQEKLMKLCLFHDLPEARTGDLNYVNKKYVTADETKAIKDMCQDSPFAQDIAQYLEEYKEGKTLEAQLAHDADSLEMMLILKQQSDAGNTQAMLWFDNAYKRLQTSIAKQLADKIRETASYDWWHSTQK